MGKTLNKIKLSDKDKKILTKHSNICTDSHGKGCNSHPAGANEKNRNLN